MIAQTAAGSALPFAAYGCGDAYHGPFTRFAVEMFNRVEIHVADLEAGFGRGELLNAVDQVDLATLADHTAFYRAIIRGHTWPNIVLPTYDLATFLLGFERSAVAYVNVAFQALRHLREPSREGFATVHRAVMASEALRGQFGKSSPDGLDARLERYEEALLKTLGDELLLVLLGTPTEPLQTAESALIDDFIEFKTVFSTPPGLDDLENLPPQTSAVGWRFLRRHSRWSLRQVAQHFQELDGCAMYAEQSHHERFARAAARSAAMAALTADVRELVDAVVALNYVNLRFEPAFGFKGCVGLPHGLIFREAERHGRSNAPVQTDVSRDKWQLFVDTSVGLA